MAPPLFSEIGELLTEIGGRLRRPLGSFLLNGGCRTACGKTKVEVEGNIGLNYRGNLHQYSPPTVQCTYGDGPCKTLIRMMCEEDFPSVNLRMNADMAKYLAGLKIGADCGIGLGDRMTGVGLESSLKRENVAIELKANADNIKQSLNCSIVGGWGNLFAGIYGIAETSDEESSADIYSVQLGHWSPNVKIVGNWDNFGAYNLSLWHKLSDMVQVQVTAGFHSRTSYRSAEEGQSEKVVIDTSVEASLEFGGIIVLTPTTKLRGYIDSYSKMNVGMETELRPDTILTLAAQIDGKNLSGGNHQFGLGFEINSDFS